MDTSQADAELEALLKEQAEFLKSGKPAAAKVTRSAPPTIGSKHTSGAGVGAPHGPSYEPQLPILNPDVVMPPLPKKKPPPQVSEASDRFERAAAEAEAHLLPPVLTEIREREPSVGVVMPPFMPPSAASSAPSASGGPLLGRRPPRGGFPRASHRSTLSAEEQARLPATTSTAASMPRDARAVRRRAGGDVAMGRRGAGTAIGGVDYPF